MAYYLGIDGGGTKSKAVLTDNNFNLLKEFHSGPTNFLSIGYTRAIDSVMSIIYELDRELNNEPVNILIGTAGAGRKKQANLFREYLVRRIARSNFSLRVTTDFEIALYGAYENNAGAILIAGTGSVLVAKDENGNLTRKGGYGKVLGDPGSGYAIGSEALKTSAKIFDGRIKPNLFTEKIIAEYGICNLDDLINLVNSIDFSPAQVVPLVLECSDERDELCCNILDRQAAALTDLFNSMPADICKNLVFTGNLLTNKNYFSGKVQKLLNENYPGINITAAKHSPEYGAVILEHKLQTSNAE